MIRMGTYRLEDRRPRNVIKPERTKRSEFSIGRDCQDIQIAAVARHTLHVPVPFPALIFFIGPIGMENLPRKPAARG